nr:NADH dehydrogenase subunit 4L [Lichtheimia hongkongensis]AIA24150.1 NADH dehydrogenase subunit 4L [Lichtheimia hongkongensis]
MNLSMVLFLIGILGFILNRKNIILMLISIEIMLLAVTLLIILSSFSFDDILGQTYGIYIIAIAGAESAIGLGILVAYYRLRGSIAIKAYVFSYYYTTSIISYCSWIFREKSW